MASLTQTFAKRVKPPKEGYKIYYDDGLSVLGCALPETAQEVSS